MHHIKLFYDTTWDARVITRSTMMFSGMSRFKLIARLIAKRRATAWHKMCYPTPISFTFVREEHYKTKNGRVVTDRDNTNQTTKQTNAINR